jgi:hypothetical protein
MNFRMPFHIVSLIFFCGAVTSLLMAEEPAKLSTDSSRFILLPKSSALVGQDLHEVSGMTASRRSSECFWFINDSGSKAQLYAMQSNGKRLANVTLESATNTDWEDLAAFTTNEKHYLIVADVGDNEAKRDFVTLFIVEEPQLMKEKLLETISPLAWKIEFRYPDGPRDCESIAVDPIQGKILLLSKRTMPPELYELPLKPKVAGVQVAKKLGPVVVPMLAGAPRHPFGTQPTSMDISPDGKTAAVLTYLGLFVYQRRSEESWSQALNRQPQHLAPHLLPQAEATSFSSDGKSLFCTSEGAGSRIVTYQSK